MAIKTMVCAALACLIVAGCGSTGRGSGAGQIVTTSYSVGSGSFYCKPSGKCQVTISDPSCDVFGTCSATLDYDPIILVKGYNHVDVTWQLPSGYGFCPDEGDGVFLKKVDPGNQFDKTGAMGADVDLGGIKKCKDSFHWNGRNTIPGDFQYRIVFRDRGTVYTIDPWIVNGN
jgi:hypothetical protein